jgi:predicted phosphohydrolase
VADGEDTLWTLVTLGVVGGILYLAWVNKDKLAALLGGLKGGGGGGTTPPSGGGTKPPTTGGGTTRPPPATGGGSPISFCAAGDWGSGRNNNWQKTVATMKALRPSVVLIPGDMSYTKNVGDFGKVVTALKGIPARVLGAQGNHDSGGFASLFAAYSNSVTNIGNTSFMSLNSNSTGGAIAFAKANMSKMTGRWKVVFMHHPVYTAKSSHGATMGGIQSTLAAGRVNLCIAAHNHNYQRFAPVGGVTHIVAGTGGESPYGAGANCGGCPALLKKTTSFGAFYAACGSSAMSCKFVTNGGGVFDSFTIK